MASMEKDFSSDYTEEMFDKIMDINIKGVFNATKVASECMMRKKSGVILNTSSMVSLYGQPGGIAYPASKFAVNGLTVSLARELGPNGIRVNAVAPGMIGTERLQNTIKDIYKDSIPVIGMGRLGKPEEIADACLYFASDLSSYTTGQILGVAGDIML